MDYVPHTQADREAMLAAVGVEQVADLFEPVPAAYRFPELKLPDALSEMELMGLLQSLSEENLDTGHFTCFLGAGAYNHYVPRIVDAVISRSEFYTAYTPYQPEVSQGTLQATFEYQSMICALTGMEVSNASHYDGATATAEAVVMALNATRGKRNKVVLSPTLHPEYRAVVRTYLQGMDIDVVGDEVAGLDVLALEGITPGLADLVDGNTACLVVQTPSFLGQIQDLTAVADKVHASGAMLVVITNPVALGLLKAPGDYHADIVAGEGQALGNGLNYGGPYLGFFACRKKDVRKMAGRLVGQTVDAEGRRGFVLTLSTREQHIRREKATSNICSNQALMALAMATHMAALGPTGIRRLAELCYHKAHYAAEHIARLDRFQVVNSAPFFHEFVVRCPAPVKEINRYLIDEWGIIGGYDLGRDYPALQDHMLLCVTEVIAREEIDALVTALVEAAEEVGR